MKTEEHVWTILVEANPVPRIDDDSDAPADLANSKPGSSGMTQLDTKRTEDNATRRRTTWIIAAFLAVVAGTVAVVFATQNGEVTPVVDQPTPTTAAVTQSTDATIAEETPDLLTLRFAQVPEGTWRVETLGTPFNIDIDGDWTVLPNNPGFIVFGVNPSQGPGAPEVVFIRPTVLSDPTDPRFSDERWPVDDIEGWLEAIIDDLVVTEPLATEVGGTEGIVFEVEEVQRGGVNFVENPDSSGNEGKKVFDPGHRYIVYWLDQAEHEPIAIIIGAPSDEFEDWLPNAESLLANLTFGEPAPYPSS